MSDAPQNDQQPPSTGNKVIGIPADKYAKICYFLVLISSAFGVLGGLVGLAGVQMPLQGLFGFLGFIGLVMSFLGYFIFAPLFNAMELSHLKLVVVLFGMAFILSILIALVFGGSVVGSLLLFLISLGFLAAIFVGFRQWQNGEIATKDGLINGLKDLKSVVGR
ncbi:MAG TPA: hypothetical protein PLF01_03555 [Alphaproteobacteria bacterium]|nr:hypothetical protein [Alphaproteobacteria bacterium]